MIELKLDIDTLFEWQEHYQYLLDFIDLGLAVLEVRPAQWLYLNLDGKISCLIKGN